MRVLLFLGLLLPVSASATTLTFNFSGIVSNSSIVEISGEPFNGSLSIQSDLFLHPGSEFSWESSEGPLIQDFQFNSGGVAFSNYNQMRYLILVNQDNILLPEGRVINDQGHLYSLHFKFSNGPLNFMGPATQNPADQINGMPFFENRRITITTEYPDWPQLHIDADITEMNSGGMAQLLDRQVVPTPEPATGLLLATGLGAYAAFKKRKKLRTVKKELA